MSPERTIRTTLVIDDKGSVRVVKGVGEESQRTEHKLGGLDKELKKVGKSFSGLKGAIGAGLGVVGAGGLLFGLADIASKTKEISLETEQFHTQTGIGITSSLYYAKALKARGLTTEQVGKAFGILSKNVKTAELQENKYALSQALATQKGKESHAQLGRQAEAFAELGINLQKFNQLTEQGKLEEITKHFERLAPGMQKTRLERELFGRGGNQLSIVLEKGNLGLTHQIELVKKFFPTIKGGANAMQELLEKQTESKMAWEGLEFTLGQKLIPVITAVMSWFAKAAVEAEAGRGPWGHLVGTFEEVVHVVKEVWGWFEGLLGPTNALRVAVGGLLGVMAVSEISSIASSFKGLGAVLPTLAFNPEFLAGIAAVTAAAALIAKFLPKPHPAQEKKIEEQHRREGRNVGGPAGFVGGGAFGGLRGGAAGERIPALTGVSGGTHAFEPNAYEQANTVHKIDLHVDSIKVAETLIRNPRAQRLIAEAGAKYANGLAAHR